jgi:hypothetical protein
MTGFQNIKLTTEINAPALRVISIAMQIRRYGAKRIAQYGRSRATLEVRPKTQNTNKKLFLAS